MSNTSNLNLNNLKVMFNTWYKICALLLCIGVALGGLGYAVEQGAITPSQSQGLISQLAAQLNQRVDALNATLQTSWMDTIGDPTFYTTQQPYAYVISNVSGYFCLQNGYTGYLVAFNPNNTYIENMALGNTTTGTIILKEVTHNTALTVPDNVTVLQRLNGVETVYHGSYPAQVMPNGGIYPGAPSYTISSFSVSNTTTYYAKAANGTIAFTSTNFSTIYQNVSDTIYTSGGGEVKLSPSSLPYLLDTTLTLRSNINIVGDQNVKIHYTGTQWAVQTKQDESVANMSLSYLTITGTSSALGGINLGSVSNGVNYPYFYSLDHVIVDSSFSGAYAVGLYLVDVSHISVTNSVFKGGLYGMEFYAATLNSGVAYFHANQFGNGIQDTNGRSLGVYFHSSASGNLDEIVSDADYFSGTNATAGLLLNKAGSLTFNSPHFEVAADYTHNHFVDNFVRVMGTAASTAIFNSPTFGGQYAVHYAISINDTTQNHQITMNNPACILNATGAIWRIDNIGGGTPLFKMSDWILVGATSIVSAPTDAQKMVKLEYSLRASAIIASNSTPDVAGVSYLSFYASNFAVTNLINGYYGQTVTLDSYTASNITIADSGVFKLSANWNSTAHDTLTLIYNAGIWSEVSRSSNNDS